MFLMSIRIGILGYGNLGKGVEKAVNANADQELVAVFTRRDPKTLTIATPSAKVCSVDDLAAMKDEIDVLVLCGGSATDLPVQTPQYAAMFNVVDSFDTHANIPTHFAAVDAAASGAGKIGVISKYGRRVIPLIENAGIQADGLIDVKGASCGATAADVGLTLGPDYRQAVNDGHNHLSPDGVIDASTALYPDHTWFIKNLEHSTVSEYLGDLFRRISYADTQITVFDDPDFPQFTVYSPIDGETAPLADGGSNNLFRRALLRMKMFFTDLWRKIRNFFAGLLPR